MPNDKASVRGSVSPAQSLQVSMSQPLPVVASTPPEQYFAGQGAGGNVKDGVFDLDDVAHDATNVVRGATPRKGPALANFMANPLTPGHASITPTRGVRGQFGFFIDTSTPAGRPPSALLDAPMSPGGDVPSRTKPRDAALRVGDKSSYALMRELRALERSVRSVQSGPDSIPHSSLSDPRDPPRLTRVESQPDIFGTSVVTEVPPVFLRQAHGRIQDSTAVMVHRSMSSFTVGASSGQSGGHSSGPFSRPEGLSVCADDFRDSDDNEEAAEPEEEQGRGMAAIGRLLDSGAWSGLVLVCTFHLLFNDDLYNLALPKDADTATFGITCAVLAVFIVEIALHAVYFKKSYLTSVFFWVDLVALLSIVPDILAEAGVYDVQTKEGLNFGLARSSRAARIGMQLGRLGKLSQRMRWMGTCCSQQEREVDDIACEERAFDDGQADAMPDSALQVMMAYKLTSKSVVLILILVFGTVLLDDLPVPTHLSALLEIYLRQPTNGTLAALAATLGPELICLNTCDAGEPAVSIHGNCSDADKVRARDVLIVKREHDGTAATLQLDIAGLNETNDIMSVFLTVFVVMVMLTHNFLLQNDVRTLCVRPIERLMHVIDNMVRDPMVRFQATDEDATRPKTEADAMIESVKTLGSLIQVGFGAAGADVVSQNLQQGRLFTMLPGGNVQAVFCFCDIRNFTAATEKLRQNVMFFVNGVAAIVHDTVLQCGGHPNKNIGDAFLLAWKFRKIRSDRLSIVGVGDGTRYAQRELEAKADSALAFTFLARERIKKSEALSLLNQKIGDGFTCTLGYGLHFGWAIEGAIGSSLKIDVSYLSPHVNIAARLEAATKQYRTDVLMSDAFCSILSQPVAAMYTRLVDRVTVKGSSTPLILYSGECCPDQRVPLDPGLLPPGNLEDALDSVRPPGRDMMAPHFIIEELMEELSEHDDASCDFSFSGSALVSHKALNHLFRLFPSHCTPLATMKEENAYDVKTIAAMAFYHYRSGEWKKAAGLWTVLGDAFDDTKAAIMLEFTAAHAGPAGGAPEGWPGFRALTEK
eukprot:TRINITY_DN5469_c1_g3_i1.p1 TRINITY_DN5469_c1_g3~~TRINITY_DN5469_c1_g3_i1.p1  ORF type:complete len:1043 (+),score=305.47 TRINITY_DN5469_c1_g3_i1:151-3279(+)